MKRLLFFLSGILGFTGLSAQDIAIGEWKSYYSYTSAQQVLNTRNRVFCSTFNGLFSVNTAGKDLRIYAKSDGLNDIGISSMGYDSVSNALLLAYRSGNIDLIQLGDSSEIGEIVNIGDLQKASGLPSGKQIHKVIFHKGLAYLGTNFGIVVLDISSKDVVEAYRYIGTNGNEVNVSDLSFTSDSLFAATSQGLLATSMALSVNRQYFANWKLISTPSNPVSVISKGNTIYAGFAGSGILKRQKNRWIDLYPSTSKTVSFTKNGENITAAFFQETATLDNAEQLVSYKDPLFVSLSEAVQTNQKKLWLADRKNGLIGNPINAFQSYSPSENDTTISVKPDSAILDLNGLVWSRLPSYLGGGIAVQNTKTGQQRVLSTVTGNGGLPSLVINSLVIDNDGYIWFGSDKGAGYFITDEILSGSRVDAILPIYGQRKLFNNERVTALAVEPGNRKWIGTASGLYLFNTDGTELVSHFTNADSPLPSDNISTLRFEGQTGLLFVDTPNGMVSYRSNSTTPEENFAKVTIFPNPVRPGYSGSLGIKGLMPNSAVKITTLSGRLVFETRSQGGTASWNLIDYTGRRVAGGIYLIMTISEDKSVKYAGKFAIID